MKLSRHDSAVSKLIKLAADPANHPLDLHCREGKDRCGTMSAILLLALGVSENDVLHDYTLSNTLLYRSTVWRLFLARAAWLLVGASNLYYIYIYVEPRTMKRWYTLSRNGSTQQHHQGRLPLSLETAANDLCLCHLC